MSALEKLSAIPNPKKGNTACLQYATRMIIMGRAKRVGITLAEYYGWYRTYEESNEAATKVTNNWNSLDLEKYNVSDANIHLILKRTYPNIDEEKGANEMRLSLQSVNNEAREIVSDDHHYEHTQFDLGIRHTILNDMCGSGKTSNVLQACKKLLDQDPDLNLILISVRISHADDLRTNAKKYIGIEAACYLDDKKRTDLGTDRITICSIQSFHRMIKGKYILVVDESETVLLTFSNDAGTHRRVSNSFNRFLEIVDASRKIFWMDSMTTCLTKDFIIAMESQFYDTIDPNSVQGMLFKPVKKFEVISVNAEAKARYLEKNGRELHEMDTKQWRVALDRALSKHKKVFVWVPFKKEVLDLQRQIMNKYSLEEDQVLAYCSESMDDSKSRKHFRNVKETWGNPNVKVVICNSKITVGLDFSTKGIFDEIFAAFAWVTNPRDFLQALFRPRHPCSTKIWVKYIEFPPRPKEFKKPDLIGPAWECLQKNFQIESDNVRSYKDRSNLRVLCQHLGIKIVPDRATFKEDLEKEYKKLVEDIHEPPKWDDIEEIGDNNVEELQIRKYNNETNLKETLQLSKWYHANYFIDNTPEGILRSSFDHHAVIMSDVFRVLNDPYHQIHKVLGENSIQIGVGTSTSSDPRGPDIPEKPICSIRDAEHNLTTLTLGDADRDYNGRRFQSCINKVFPNAIANTSVTRNKRKHYIYKGSERWYSICEMSKYIVRKGVNI